PARHRQESCGQHQPRAARRNATELCECSGTRREKNVSDPEARPPLAPFDEARGRPSRSRHVEFTPCLRHPPRLTSGSHSALKAELILPPDRLPKSFLGDKSPG